MSYNITNLPLITQILIQFILPKQTISSLTDSHGLKSNIFQEIKLQQTFGSWIQLLGRLPLSSAHNS